MARAAGPSARSTVLAAPDQCCAPPHCCCTSCAGHWLHERGWQAHPGCVSPSLACTRDGVRHMCTSCLVLALDCLDVAMRSGTCPAKAQGQGRTTHIHVRACAGHQQGCRPQSFAHVCAAPPQPHRRIHQPDPE